MTTRLTESGKVTSSGGKFRAILITEGVGSSGTYPGEMLQRDGAVAFPAGTQIFFDHLTENEEWDRNGQHSIKDLVGVTLTDATWSEAERALEADIKFFSAYADFINEAKDFIGLSIEASAIRNSEGLVESLLPSPFNAIAVVPRAGRGGKITALLESYREKHNTDESAKLRENAGSDTGKEQGMTPEEIEKVAEALADAIKPSLTELKEALAPKPAEKPEEEAPDTAEVAEALVASNLPEAARKRVYEGLKVEGADINALIENEKKYIESVAESLKAQKDDVEPDPGVVREGATKTEPTVLSVSGWSL